MKLCSNPITFIASEQNELLEEVVAITILDPLNTKIT